MGVMLGVSIAALEPLATLFVVLTAMLVVVLIAMLVAMPKAMLVALPKAMLMAAFFVTL